MQPTHIIIFFAIAGVLFFLWTKRQKLSVAISAALLQIVDAVVVAYAVYLVTATIFDFSSYHTWSGATRILFFSSTPDGAQYFAIFAGIAMGYLRFFQRESSGPLKTEREYVGGRKIWSHRSAIIVAQSLVAHRADATTLERPQHLDKTASYNQPDREADLDSIRPVAHLETILDVTPFVSTDKEYGTVLWGMIRIPYEMTNLHFVTVGATGSGKTVLIHALMKSVLPRIKTDKSFRAFVYDDKPDFLPFARELGLEDFIWNFDPFDANAFAWDIAADVTTTAEAMQVASVLAPVDPKVNDPYWQQATQDFLSAVLLNFHEVNGIEWTLRDVMLTFSSENRLRTILARDPKTERLARFYLGAHSLNDVLAVLQSRLGPFGVAASLYSRAKVKKSVREWRKSNAILLVTGRSIFTQAVKPINQALFRMVSLLLLNESDVKPGQNQGDDVESNWIFLDELREIGKLHGYHELANKGRSKGVRLVLGFQSIEGMKAEHGDNEANEIVNLCSHRTFLHTTSVETRNWEADQVGNVVLDETVFDTSQSTSKNDGWSNSVSTKTNRETRQGMEASDFDQNLKLATPENGVTSLNMIPYIGTYVSWVPWNWVAKHLPFPRPEFRAETLRTGDEQKLDDWKEDDFSRLKISPTILDDGNPNDDDEEDEDRRNKSKRRGKKSKEKSFGKTKRRDV